MNNKNLYVINIKDSNRTIDTIIIERDNYNKLQEITKILQNKSLYSTDDLFLELEKNNINFFKTEIYDLQF